MAQLQKTVEEMSQAFLDFNDKTLASGLIAYQPHLGHNLKETMERVVQLSKDANIDHDVDDGGRLPLRKRAHSSDDAVVEQAPKAVQHRDNQDTSMLDTGMTSTASAQTFEPTISHQSTNLPAFQNGQQDTLTAMVSTAGSSWMDTPCNLQQYHTQIPDIPQHTNDWMSLENMAPDPIASHSSQETTFARRLIRHSYERCYLMLTNPATPPELIKDKFRYSLCFTNLDSLKGIIGDVVASTAQEPLGNFNLPDLHLGGSGLHYPRNKGCNDPEPPGGWISQRMLRPWPWPNVQTAPPEQFPDGVSLYANMEGVWFDGHDVEMYLRSKGLRLDDSSLRAQIEIQEDSPTTSLEPLVESPSTSASGTISGPQSPEAQKNDLGTNFFSPQVEQFFSNLENGTANLENGLDFDFTLMNNAVEDKGMDAPGFAPNSLFGSLPSGQSRKRARKVTIDVDRLLNGKQPRSHMELGSTRLMNVAELNQRSVCIGKGPGYRPADVDMALSRVLQEAC